MPRGTSLERAENPHRPLKFWIRKTDGNPHRPRTVGRFLLGAVGMGSALSAPLPADTLDRRPVTVSVVAPATRRNDYGRYPGVTWLTPDLLAQGLKTLTLRAVATCELSIRYVPPSIFRVALFA